MVSTDIPQWVLKVPELQALNVTTPTAENDNTIDLDMLTPEQRANFDRIIDYIDGKLETTVNMQLLEGYAGTGKTTLVSKLIKYIVLMRQKMVAVTAPTNKAVKVLKKQASYNHNLVVYKTIHSLLGLKPDNDDMGKLIFTRSNDPEDAPLIDEIDVLFIDETSQLEDSLNDLITPYVGKLKLIYIGDPIQIPPVNKADCIPFIEQEREKRGIERLVLSTVIRQKATNPILHLATTVREHYKSPSIPWEWETITHNDNSGIIMIDRHKQAEASAIMEAFFCNEHFSMDSDYMKVIAWSNDSVNKINNLVRKIIYKDQPLQKVMIGEKLIADKPITEKTPYGHDILFTTNDEFEVESYEIDRVKVFGNYHVYCYTTKVFYFDIQGKRKTQVIKILHEKGEPEFRKIQDILKKEAKNEKDPFERKKKWRIYFSVVGQFADVKYNYAITAHKSQGSTYDNCMVIYSNIILNSRIEERNRISYVSFTRAKNLLFIVR